MRLYFRGGIGSWVFLDSLDSGVVNVFVDVIMVVSLTGWDFISVCLAMISALFGDDILAGRNFGFGVGLVC